MGSFANTIFSVMLGWVRSAANWLWQLAGSSEGSGAIRWLGENWLMLTVILCAIGMAVDFIVHMLRWRPYKVWASFFRRMFGKQEEAADAAEAAPPIRRTARRPAPRPMPRPPVQRQWMYADGTAGPEEPLADNAPEQPWPEAEPPRGRASSAEMSRSYLMKFARPEPQETQPAQLRYQEELNRELPVQGLEDYPQPKPAPLEQPAVENTASPSQTGRHSKRVTRVTARHFFENSEDEIDLRYRPAPPAVDKREAYGQPYYPPQWRKPADVGASDGRKEDARATDSPV